MRFRRRSGHRPVRGRGRGRRGRGRRRSFGRRRGHAGNIRIGYRM